MRKVYEVGLVNIASIHKMQSKRKLLIILPPSIFSKSSIWLYIIPCFFFRKKKTCRSKSESSTISKSYLTLRFFDFFGILRNRVFSKLQWSEFSFPSVEAPRLRWSVLAISLRNHEASEKNDVDLWMTFFSTNLTGGEMAVFCCFFTYKCWCPKSNVQIGFWVLMSMIGDDLRCW